MRFAGADDGYGGAEYALAGFPLDVTSSFRPGSRFAPSRIREASRSFETYVRGASVDVADAPFHDHGDLDAWNDAGEAVEFAAGTIEGFTEDRKVPIVLGGEHTVSVAGFRGTDASSVVVFDAHLDLKDEFEGDTYSHACVARRAAEEGRDVHIVGAREGSGDEWGYAEESQNVYLHDIDGFDPDLKEPYVSVDLDVLDPGYAPGVGTPVPGGASPDELFGGVRSLAPHAVGFDVVEACPAYGSGEAEFIAASLVRDFVAFSHR